MNEHLENLQLTLTSPRKRAPTTIIGYMNTATNFLAWLGDRTPPSDKDLRRYFLAREEQGIAGSTRRTEFAQLKKLCEANSWPWPFTSDDKPIEEEEPFAPAFLPDEILQLIACREEYSPQENFYLAVSVTYGRRSEELGRITARHIKENTIVLRIAKKRKPPFQRQHLIPEEIQPILSSWRPRQRGAKAVRVSFKRIMEKSGLGKRPGYNFHSIRRTLSTLLEINLAKNDYPPSLAAQYMDWAKTSIGARYMGSVMAGVYAHPEVISADPFQVDRIIHSVHPFLPGYRNG